MDIEALRSFAMVAREKSFSRAAKLLHISQPAMSVRIKTLEEELGERLFDRARQGVALTEAGAVLLDAAQRIFADVEEAHTRLQELRAAGAGRVRLGCSDTVSLYLLPAVLGRFRRKRPGAEIHIRNAYTAEICDLLLRGELDFGIVTKPVSLDSRLESRELFREDFVVACRKDDALLRRKTIALSALDGRPMVALAKGTATRDATDRALRGAKVRPQIVVETGNIEVQKRYAQNGLGFAILPACAVADADKRRLAWRPLRGTPLQRSVVVVLSRNRYLPRAANALLTLLEATTQKS